MSRAFVKGDESDLPESPLPERPLGEAPYYVTPAGLAQLRSRSASLLAEHAALKAAAEEFDKPRLQEVERDLRYLSARIDGAVQVDVLAQPQDEVHFGARVSTRDAQGRQARYDIVGDDEADITHGRISYRSPLAQALMGAHIGEWVSWQRPAGAVDLEITAIEYQANH